MILGLTPLQFIIAATVALSVTSFALIVYLLIKLRRYRRQQLSLFKSPVDSEKDIVELINKYIAEVQDMHEKQEKMGSEVKDLAYNLKHTLQHFSVVRHDAFEDVGGRQSFSAAILDDFGDGIVFSSIHARNENRVYAKPIKKGESLYRLSTEELEAIENAKRAEGITFE